MSLHIYSANLQPATNFVDDTGVGKPFRFRCAKRQPLWAVCCKRKRIAGDCNVQVYYDGPRAYCKPGKGCKAVRR